MNLAALAARIRALQMNHWLELGIQESMELSPNEAYFTGIYVHVLGGMSSHVGE